MSVRISCSLCYTPTCLYEKFQNESGEINKVYEITVKYFDPMLLTGQEDSEFVEENKGLCPDCWLPIKQFHEFQQNVIETRKLLEKTEIEPLLMKTIIENDFEDTKSSFEVDVEGFDRSDDDDGDANKEHLFVDRNFENLNYVDSSISNDEVNREFESGDSVTMRQEEEQQSDDRDFEDLSQVESSISNNEVYGEFERSDNSVTMSQFEEIFIERVLEDSDYVDPSISNDEEDEHPLINWKNENSEMENGDIPTKKSRSDVDKVKKRNNTFNLENQKPKARKGRKPKINNKIININENSELENGDILRKKSRLDVDKVEKGYTTFNLERGREFNALIAEWKPVLECDLCSETATNYNTLRIHFKENHNSPFYIKCCERKFYRRYLLANHIQLHINPGTHKCEICGILCANKGNLVSHTKVMHGETEQLECGICNKLYSTQVSLDRHLLTHITGDKKFKCQECNRAYVHEIQLKEHIKRIHQDTFDGVCEQCGKKIHGIPALKRHIIKHANITKPKFPCDICAAELKSPHDLLYHRARYHHDFSYNYDKSSSHRVKRGQKK